MKILEDVFDIGRRLKEVDISYTLCYENSRYVLRGARDEYVMTFPYKSLTPEMVTEARRTRVERINALIAELDAENERLEREAREERRKATYESVENAVRNRKSRG